MVEVVLEEDEHTDEFLELLHELALEAIALRATSPGDPHGEPAHPPASSLDDADGTSPAAWLRRRVSRRGVARTAAVTAAALAVAIVPGEVDERRAAERLAELVTDPGVLEQVTGPPEVLWRTPTRVTNPPPGDATPPASASIERTLPGGELATWSWDPDGDSGQGSVRRADGSWVFGLWGPPVVPALTDESEAGTLVIVTPDGNRLLGRTLRTGASRWSVPYRGEVPVTATAQVDGVLLLDDGTTVAAIDVRSGEELWRAPVASDLTDGSALTDGTLVLLPVHEDGQIVLVATRIADGAVLWHSTAPSGTVALTVTDHRLVASTSTALVGLG